MYLHCISRQMRSDLAVITKKQSDIHMKKNANIVILHNKNNF